MIRYTLDATIGIGIGCVFGIGYFLGRITEARRHMTRSVSLDDFSKLTQSR